MAKAKKYIVLDKFKQQPRAIRLNGKWVGVGGKITRVAKPPKLDQVIPEATDKEYLEIAKINSYLVQLI